MDISANMKTYPKYKDSGVEWLGEIPEHWDGRHKSFLFDESISRKVPHELILSLLNKEL